ncbi:MAG: hypothetical protein IJ374_06205 [Lachnospiraceae bacterium]|nr:hypothetical protein [Lachnospiraceae bacterium]
MRKHFNRFFTTMMLAVSMIVCTMQTFAAETVPVVETITLDDDFEWDSDIPSDISWRTKQDKGQWIEDLGIAREAKSLILVINNLDKVDTEAIPGLESEKMTESERRKLIAAQNRLNGKSRLSYFSKDMDGEWQEIFSVDCFISGGGIFEKEEVYGVYTPVSTFGTKANPGSLLPYRNLSPADYWSVDPESEQYGTIFSVEKSYERPERAVNLEGLKAYSHYGMILNPEDDYSSCPSLVVNCQQHESNDDVLSGIHMPEDNLRMMIQSIDQNTRIMIAGDLESLENM